MTLFEECIQALGDKVEIMSSEKTQELFKHLVKNYPVTLWGRIDWDKIKEKYKIHLPQESLKILNKKYPDHLNNIVFLLWNYSDATCVKTELQRALDCIDDVTAVGSDTWIYCPTEYVIEFFHEGEVTLGF